MDFDLAQIESLVKAYESAAFDIVRYAFSIRALASYILLMVVASTSRILFPGKISLLLRLATLGGIFAWLVLSPEFHHAFQDSPIGYVLALAVSFWIGWVPPFLLTPVLRLLGVGMPQPVDDDTVAFAAPGPAAAAAPAPSGVAAAAASAAAGKPATNIYASGVATQGVGNVETRQETTIMLTDIVGYSKMMEKDEKATYELLKKHNEIMRKQIAAHSGREIKTMGDAFMVTFPLPMNAVKCGIAMQRALYAYNKDRLLHEQIKIRIGVHCGEATVTKNDVFGEAVNIAARLEPLTTPGGMSISADVYQHVKNKIEAGFQSIGVQPMKNIASPPEVFRVSFSPE